MKIKVWDKKNKEYLDDFIIEKGPFGMKVYYNSLDFLGGYHLEPEDYEIEIEGD